MIATIRSTLKNVGASAGAEPVSPLAYSHPEARRKVAQMIADRLVEWLEEHANMTTARDHVVMVRPYGVHGGLALDETCTAPPCPWMGQAADDTNVIERNVVSVWYEAQE